MSERTFGIMVRHELEGPLVCFGKIRRDALTMQLVLDEIEGIAGAPGAIIGDQDLLDSLGRLMVIGKAQPGSDLCGPMFWEFRKAMNRAVGEAEV